MKKKFNSKYRFEYNYSMKIQLILLLHDYKFSSFLCPFFIIFGFLLKVISKVTLSQLFLFSFYRY